MINACIFDNHFTIKRIKAAKDFTVLHIYHVTINTRCPTALFPVPKYYLQHTAWQYIYACYATYKFHMTIISYRSRDHNEHEVILEIAYKWFKLM